MKLFDQKLEFDVIKRICSGNQEDQSLLLGTIDRSYFYSNIALEAFDRIKLLAKEKTEIPSWNALTSDIAISEESREVLRSYDLANTEESFDTKSEIDHDTNFLIKNLREYRKARIIHGLSEKIQSELLQDSLDINKLYDVIVEKITEAKSGKSFEECFTRIGDNSNVLGKLKKLLDSSTVRYIPTGFKGWDTENSGIPIGKLGILAATSGGGKSLCANQLAINMAMNNVKTCIVPLEMSAQDMLHRFMANLTFLDMSRITKSHQMDKTEKVEAIKMFRAFEKKIAATGASIDLFNPSEDITMEDLLFLLRPFGYNVIIIDYIGLLKGFEREDGWRKMMDAVRFAKRWAETTGTAVIILAQLSEDMIIRYSKGMKEHADWMWTWNAGKLNETDGQTILKIEPQKGRNQAQTTFYLNVNYKKMSMVDATEEEIKWYESQKKQKKSSNSKETDVIQKGQVDNDLYGDL